VAFRESILLLIESLWLFPLTAPHLSQPHTTYS
jgi:hypothetical protein